MKARCARFLRANHRFGGVIRCLPNYGDENGAVAALKPHTVKPGTPGQGSGMRQENVRAAMEHGIAKINKEIR